MASKVMVKLPVTPFGQVNKSKSGAVNGEIVLPANGNRASDVPREPPKPSDNPRVTQLEQNIRFLQEQHQLMLTGLHGEIEGLKIRNRELQFQLVFFKGSIPSSPSSPEDDSKPKSYVSPKVMNSTPLQVEILEKELGELKLQLQEVESRNVYLSAIVDEQKRKLEKYERDREKEREQRVANQSDENSELMRKLEDAEAIIRRLRRENSDLRRETCNPQGHYQQQRENSGHQQRRESNGYQSPRGGNGHHQGRGNRGHKGNGQYNRGNNWFPPLHSQSFWQGSILVFSLVLAAIFAPLSLL